MRLIEIDNSIWTKEQWAKYIVNNCEPFLEESSGTFVYHGRRHPITSPLILSIKGRQPRDTASHIHEYIVDVLNELGATANRNNSIFVTGDKEEALSKYGGYLYYVFPIGNFNYTWIKGVSDLTEDMENVIIANENKKTTLEKFSSSFDVDTDEIYQYDVLWDESGIKPYFDNGLYQAIADGYEIMIKSEKVILLRSNETEILNLIKQLTHKS